MQITEIKRRGKSELYYVYADGELHSLIEAEYIYKNKLKVGTEISKQDLDNIKKQSDMLVCSNMALKYVSKMVRSEFQVKKYLKDHGFFCEAIDSAIEKLKSYGYINDEHFAKLVVDNLKLKKGKKAIKKDLMAKGIDRELIDSCLLDLSGQEEVCFKLAQKWLKNKQFPISQNDKAKLYRFLFGRGFEFDIIKGAMSKLGASDEHDWD